ncbi:MAG: acetolactate synthase large subunit [Chloroflexota bacterium]|nr:acetolactate synthase large subunit [Chloroflexota bacterium]
MSELDAESQHDEAAATTTVAATITTEPEADSDIETSAEPEPPDAAAEPEADSVVDTSAEPEAPEAAVEPPAGPRTVGRFIADALRTAGVRYAFTVPGESFLGLLDALEGAGIRVIATRHEGPASFMAEAHGQLTGRPALCIGTRAVGGSNLAIGIHTARQNSTPLFVAVGQVERAFLGREAFQEIDQVATLGGLAKWAAEPHSTGDVPAVVSEAIRQALGGRPGPVLLSLPEDLLDESMPDESRVEASRASTPRPTDDQIRSIIELLASAQRPLILAGAGVLRARTSTELTRFAELLQVPVIAAWRRADVISNDHPLYLGMAGLGAASSVRERLDAADAVLVIGSRLNEATTYGYTVPRDGLRWAHVDLEPGRPAGLSAPEIAVAADAKAFLRSANERLVGRAVLDAALVAARQASNATDRAAWEAASVVDADPWDGPGVHPGRTVTTLRRVLPDDAILTTDAGNFAGWLGRGFRFRRPGTFLGSTSGAMGYGLPAAITAALVHRDRAVVALVGDGGLGMTMAELETSVRVGARVVVVAFDNERYGTIRMWQERRGTGVGTATDLGPVDFAAIARACGARGVKVDRDAEFEPALRAALAADRSTVIHVALDRRWLSVDQPPA